jgi:hypothetical protein
MTTWLSPQYLTIVFLEYKSLQQDDSSDGDLDRYRHRAKRQFASNAASISGIVALVCFNAFLLQRIDVKADITQVSLSKYGTCGLQIHVHC